ncbi:MAG: OB-fold nucleic acid binding domain-containing protein [Clostridia bacterium]|nr:OB-fold nucleic acid binding domain-containing protein [Clostridia bacterium]
MQPTSLADIIAAIALFRPGPMDAIDTFIDRKHGKAKIEYKIPQIAPILDVTYGCIVYQEQVMQICRTLAGYSYARADIVRRAMAKKKTEAMLAEREDFLNGAEARGIDRSAAEEIFGQMTSFAQYAFNKSHATAYAVITYRTAYLKAHYPAEFYAALMTSVLNNPGKVREYIMDAAKCGVKVLRPDINESGANFSVTDGHIRYGLLAIKNVGRLFTEAVERERKVRPFTSFDSFVSRMAHATELNRRTLDFLIKCGVFDSLGVPRAALLSCCEEILIAEQQKSRNNITGQMDLFSIGSPASSESHGYRYPDIPEYSKKDLLSMEKECSGTYFSGHLLDSYEKNAERIRPDKISEILADFEDENAIQPKYHDKSEVTLVGVITAVSLKKTKNGDSMATFNVDDKYGELGVIAFPKLFEKYGSLIAEENVLAFRGTINEERTETDDGVKSQITLRLLSVTEMVPDEDDPDGKLQERLLMHEKGRVPSAAPAVSPKQENVPAQNPTAQRKDVHPDRIVIRMENRTPEAVKVLERLGNLNAGPAMVLIFENSTRKYTEVKNVRLSAAPTVLDRLTERFGKENVVYQKGNG